ncbi:hypothetical protein NC652_029143 [Populus alba x Populus x berolinensis]|nr:hypothetical protein NC652_029143 [Populus alba x Populus x berolinensis]
MRQLRQTQAITEANATVQVHATSNSTNGESRAKTKGKAKEGKKTGHPSLDGDEKNRPRQHAEEMDRQQRNDPAARPKKEHKRRKLRQTQAITTANATIQAHAAIVNPPAAKGPRKQKRKQQKVERLDSGEKNRPHQRAEDMELGPIRHSTGRNTIGLK